MLALSLREIADVLGGALTLAADDTDGTLVDGAAETDSRPIVPGGVFFALPGEVTDGHLFIDRAIDAGAVLVIAERPDGGDAAPRASRIVVSDGTAALAALARHVVGRVRESGLLRVVAVTGSNGKTTTKNLLAAVLGAAGPTVAPRGSFNNRVGAPLSMLAVDASTAFLVVEMGASAPGDIAALIDIVIPDVAIVLKVGLAHAGGFGSIEGTQRAKAEIVTRLPATALAVLNIDDTRVAAMAEQTAASVSWFGLGTRADVRAVDIDLDLAGTSFHIEAGEERADVRMRILGEHHVMNVLATVATALHLGVPLTDAVAAIESVSRAERWRMEVLAAPNGVTVINDAYNASPDSMAAALKTLAQLTRGRTRSFAVLGEMSELGDAARDEHDAIGRLVVRLGIGQLVVVGHGARHLHVAANLEGSWDGESVLVDTAEEALAFLDGRLRPGDVVLVKSSNSAGLRFLGDRLAGLTA